MIGLFDSGVGGFSVWREIARQLPHHDTVYVADQALCAILQGAAFCLVVYQRGDGVHVALPQHVDDLTLLITALHGRMRGADQLVGHATHGRHNDRRLALAYTGRAVQRVLSRLPDNVGHARDGLDAAHRRAPKLHVDAVRRR